MTRAYSFFAMLLVLATASTAEGAAYRLTPLPSPDSLGGARAEPVSVNAAGDIVGVMTDGSGSVVWRKSQGYAFEPLPDQAVAITDNGTIVTATLDGSTVYRPSGKAEHLSFVATAASDAYVVGQDAAQQVVLWNGSGVSPILRSDSTAVIGRPTSVNNAGTVVGEDFDRGAFVYGSSLRYLEGYANGSSLRISDAGFITGSGRYDPSSPGQSARIWNGDGIEIQDLGYGNSAYGRALDLLPFGILCTFGDRALPYSSAVIDGSEKISLLSLAGESDLRFPFATDVSSAGHIVGHAFDPSIGVTTAFLLTPTPEPGIAAFALTFPLLAGRRRNR